MDVSADEDCSRVRHRAALWALGMFRRMAIGLFIHSRDQSTQRVKASLADFHWELNLKHPRRAFALVNAKKSDVCETS